MCLLIDYPINICFVVYHFPPSFSTHTHTHTHTHTFPPTPRTPDDKLHLSQPFTSKNFSEYSVRLEIFSYIITIVTHLNLTSVQNFLSSSVHIPMISGDPIISFDTISPPPAQDPVWGSEIAFSCHVSSASFDLELLYGVLYLLWH